MNRKPDKSSPRRLARRRRRSKRARREGKAALTTGLVAAVLARHGEAT